MMQVSDLKLTEITDFPRKDGLQCLTREIHRIEVFRFFPYPPLCTITLENFKGQTHSQPLP